MSRIFFDGSSGVSSDMILGALLRLGADADRVASALRGLGSLEFRLKTDTVERRGVTGYAARIEIIGAEPSHAGGGPPGHAHASYRDVAALFERASIDPVAKGYALAAYRALATAEAAAHGTTTDEVHFHEVGSPRAVYTVTGAAIAAGLLGATDFACGALTDGSGHVVCSHGEIPVPVPAVRELLKLTDIPLRSDENIRTELVTPTGLALLIGFGCRYADDAPPSRSVEGYGFGTRDVGLLGAVRAVLI
jgi:uncharacterized protein (DUF111 family)